MAPILLVALPFVLLVLRECLRRPDYAYAGDEALIELDVRRVLHGDMPLGAYSRFGWRHPGSSWYSLLALPYRVLGGHGWSLTAAVVLLSGLAAVGVVVVARRLGGPVPGVLAGLLILLLARQLDVALFRLPWNPVAVVLPAALFLLLAVAWLLGHATAAGWTLVLGSVLVQTHVGTGVVVVAVTAVAAAVRGTAAALELRDRRGSPASGPSTPNQPTPNQPKFSQAAARRRRLRRALGFAGLLGLIWLGPVLQQLTTAPGNLGVLGLFAAKNPGRLSWSVSAGYLSSPLAVITGRPLPLGSVLPHASASLALAAALAGIVLLGLGRLLASRVAMAVALVFLTALVAAVQTVRQNVGPEYGYLTLWMTVLPVVLVLGYVLLVSDVVASRGMLDLLRSRRVPSVAWVAVSVAGLVLVLTAPPATVFGAKPAGPQRRLNQLALAAVGREHGLVLIRDDGERRWPQAAGIVLALRRAGVAAKVPRAAAVLFSAPYVSDAAADGAPAVTLQLLPVPGPALGAGSDAGCVLGGMPGTCLRLLR
ncbi:MAG: hypothetical protein QOG60_2099 [Frankiaceae bacterium]|nr:hypothetical protein [Frankiaceae bacterium]